MAGESTSVVIMMGSGMAAMFSAMLALVWTIIKRYERLLDLNSQDFKTLLEGTNRALAANNEQGRSLLEEVRGQRQTIQSVSQGITSTGQEIIRNQQAFQREIDGFKTRLEYATRRAWPDGDRRAEERGT